MSKTREELLEEVSALVQKTGRVYVAEDVYEALRDHPSVEMMDTSLPWWPLRYGRIDVLVSRHLPPGSILAADPGGFISRDSRG